jgi:hypothetical protein
MERSASILEQCSNLDRYPEHPDGLNQAAYEGVGSSPELLGSAWRGSVAGVPASRVRAEVAVNESSPRSAESASVWIGCVMAAIVGSIVLVTETDASSAAASTRGAGQPAARYVLEQDTRDRWMHGSQRPEFTRFSETSTSLYLGLPPSGPGEGERTIRIAIGNPLGDSAEIVAMADGRVVRQQSWVRAFPAGAPIAPIDSARMSRLRWARGGRLVLPVARVWDVIPTVRPRRFTAGERWTDTIALATEHDGARQAIAGVRHSVLRGDTVVAGRQHWIVSDSADVRYTDHELQHERTLDTLVAIDRSAAGIMRSRYLFDPELRLFRDRVDTTALSGEAVLRYPDGRTFRTPARYERRRQWTLYEPDAFAARQASRRAEMQRTYSGPVQAPANVNEQRLAAGDTALRDSLATAWDRERDPNRREDLYRLLLLWGVRTEAYRETLETRRETQGDSAFIIDRLARRAYPARPAIDTGVARALIRVMGDPGISFALGVSRDWLYENVVQTLTTWPPAIEPDSSRWRCTPAACRILGEQWRTAQEPRLRDVGLAALVATDPGRWADTAVARLAAGSTVIERVAHLANGVGATWPAAAKLPIPPAGAEWRAWRAWSNTLDPAYARVQRSSSVRVPQDAMRFDESHATAIRFYQRRTGRDVVGELRRHLAAATDDSARLVYGTILAGLGERPGIERVVAQLRSGSPPQVSLGAQSVPGLFRTNPPLADSATTVAILDRLIATLVDGGEPWPTLRPDARRPPAGRPPGPTPYMLADSVPPSLRAKWGSRVRFISSVQWQQMSLREAATLVTLSSVHRVGDLVRVSEHVSGRLARAAGEVPRLFYSGSTFYLLASNGGWVVVTSSMWVT